MARAPKVVSSSILSPVTAGVASDVDPSNWIRRLGGSRETLRDCTTSSPPADTRLLIFPHAGGTAGDYSSWLTESSTLSVYSVQYPGRASRFAEPAIPDVGRMAVRIADCIWGDGRVILFGHSFGALVAFATARELRRRGSLVPPWLVVSSFPAPDDVPDVGDLVALGPEGLLRTLDGLHGSVPAEVLANEHMVALVGKYVRSDYQAIHDWTYSAEPALETGLLTLMGADDSSVAPSSMARWREHVTGLVVAEEVLPGGHFYLWRPENAARIAHLLNSLATSLSHRKGRPEFSGGS